MLVGAHEKAVGQLETERPLPDIVGAGADDHGFTRWRRGRGARGDEKREHRGVDEIERRPLVVEPGMTELERGQLQSLLPEWTPVPGETPLYALYPLQRHLAPKVRAFIDFMVEWL